MISLKNKLRSASMKVFITVSFIFFLLFWVLNIMFDNLYSGKVNVPALNLDKIYKPPDEYNNMFLINLKLEKYGFLGIEGNQKFIILDRNKDYAYYDTIQVMEPDTSLSFYNIIYIKFQNSPNIDSVYFVVSKSTNSGIFWNQVFYSSVKIKNLNAFSDTPEKFRIDSLKLVNNELLSDNDTLIKQVQSYFNENRNSLGLWECETNSRIFKSICDKFNLPCRIIKLQGGYTKEGGFNNLVGNPIHVTCEVYSSLYRKWFVLDPSYGSVFKKENIPLSAAEISSCVFFGNDSTIIEDSVLSTWKSNIGPDYFNYYRNVYYISKHLPNLFIRQIVKLFYNRFNYQELHFSYKIIPSLNGRIYIEKKTIMYLITAVVYVIILILTLKRFCSLKYDAE